MNSEYLSQTFWEQLPHSELPSFGPATKTEGDLQAIESILSPSDIILDLGCGWGRITHQLANRGYQTVGIDLSENLISYARKIATETGLNVDFRVGSLLDIPAEDQAFDKIVCLWGVFNHLLHPAEQLQALNEMHRVLKPGGIALIEMGNSERKKYQELRQTVCYGPDKRIWNSQFKADQPPNVLYLHDRQTLKQLAEQSAFESFKVAFQNINHKRRIVTKLFKPKV